MLLIIAKAPWCPAARTHNTIPQGTPTSKTQSTHPHSHSSCYRTNPQNTHSTQPEHTPTKAGSLRSFPRFKQGWAIAQSLIVHFALFKRTIVRSLAQLLYKKEQMCDC